MKLIDTHAHVYLDKFDEDREEVISRASENNVEEIYLSHIDSRTTADMLALEEKYPGVCKPMMGLHPCSVDDSVEKELKNIENRLAEHTFAAIGEIGLDFYWDDTYAEQQKEAFRRQIDWAKDMKMPIVIHCRNAFEEVYRILKEKNDQNLTGIFHCFAGSEEEGKRLMDLDFYLGIGGIVTFKNAGLDKVVSELPLERLVLETDCPFLAPHPYRGKRNEPAYISVIGEKVAEVNEQSLETVADSTTQNAHDIFNC